MMSDLIERLRHWQENCNDEYMHELAGRAADRIEKLEANQRTASNNELHVAITEKNKQIAELEENIELALRLGTFFVGFVPDVLRGRKFSELPQDVQDFLNHPALQEQK
jgi:hypothetical protein